MPFARQLQALALWLENTRPLWHPQPFKCLSLPWEAEHAAVAAWARSLHKDALEAFEIHPTGHPTCPPVLKQWARTNQDLSSLPQHVVRDLPWRTEDTRWVQARKWDQLTLLAGTVVPLLDEVPHVVDWCSGKGHLARGLAQWSSRPVVGIERRATLCREGNRLARRRGLPVILRQGDVLAPESTLPSVQGGALVALHACGSLTDAALTHAHQGGARLTAVVPCCLQALGEGLYGPRSIAGRGTGLRLERSDLYLAMGEEQVANHQVRRRRRTELAWRSALDLILRQVLGRPTYTRLPSLPRRTWDKSFAAFCQQMDRREDLGLPSGLDLEAFEALGWARSHEARALGIIRGVFRRAIEVWVALDRGQWLAEQGWSVRAGTFCPLKVTPRNVLLLAQR